ncbi:MAG: FMN-binding protein [Spirochaetia bacterium]|jgi:major membrane immunogen (membrane-anchored lipoprotein)|nr:FMN-binding protein [Spirochaetia bacterium]
MKKSIVILMAFVSLVATLSAGAQVKAKDGFYFAEENSFQSSGWKDQVVLQVKGGKIVYANWNGINTMNLEDKKTVSSSGSYGMIKASKIGKEWHQQAFAVEKYLVDTQDVGFSKIKADGTTDAISGASLHVKGFFDLVKAALASAPIAKGSYSKDGWFYAKAPGFDKNGFMATALIAIANGRIVSVKWNAINKAGGDSKFIRAIKGTYKMNAKQGEWNMQAPRVEASLIQTQDPAKIAVRADGKTDAISGVSVTIDDFIAVTTAALKAAK